MQRGKSRDEARSNASSDHRFRPQIIVTGASVPLSHPHVLTIFVCLCSWGPQFVHLCLHFEALLCPPNFSFILDLVSAFCHEHELRPRNLSFTQFLKSSSVLSSICTATGPATGPAQPWRRVSLCLNLLLVQRNKDPDAADKESHRRAGPWTVASPPPSANPTPSATPKPQPDPVPQANHDQQPGQEPLTAPRAPYDFKSRSEHCMCTAILM